MKSSSRKRHKSTRTYKPIELKLDATPEGIVSFSKYMIELVGDQKIDTRRASCVNGWVQTILRTNESGIDAVKQIEEDTHHLAETLRTIKPNARQPTS